MLTFQGVYSVPVAQVIDQRIIRGMVNDECTIDQAIEAHVDEVLAQDTLRMTDPQGLAKAVRGDMIKELKKYFTENPTKDPKPGAATPTSAPFEPEIENRSEDTVPDTEVVEGVPTLANEDPIE